MSSTTIKRASFYRARSPLSRPIADATHEIDAIEFVVTRLELADGTVGESYLLAFEFSPHGIAGALKDAAPLVEGREVCETGRFLRDFEQQSEYFGINGLHRWAQGAINLAMWDAWARVLGQPVWKLFGVCHHRVPLYGSGGWLSYTPDELVDEVTRYVSRGFRAVKIKVGSPELERDLERLHKVREAVGPGIRIMMDANQGMNLPNALELARAARPIGIHWFEEPLPHTDFEGYAHLRRQAGMSIAMGEREFDLVPLRELIRREAIDLWQPDILRLGSVEAWRDSAALAHAHHLPVLPHYYKEYDVPLLMTIPNPYGAESFDWVDGIITHPIRMQDGFAYPNPGPGWGFRFKDEALQEL
ncbi:MAG: mandelate racemase/muconate lactonizing enzyme family protein [Verrucomicrobiota bacterium JB022]|nr:mandelate racemase/muconate lactonizing enzyme family protein [Verrucomicrobiota bacterium JB022]